MAESEDTNVKTPESLPDELDNAVAQGGSPEPEVQLSPKARRQARRAKSRPSGGASKPKTPEEREAARLERRAHNAKLRRNYRQRAKTKRSEARAAAPAPDAGVAEPASEGRPKVRRGIVVSDKADKTIVVRIDVARRHRRYGKTIRSSSKLHVHDEANDAGTGDTVRVVESRPMSATKRWRLVEVTERAR